MKKYRVIFTELTTHEIFVNANSEQQAIDFASGTESCDQDLETTEFGDPDWQFERVESIEE